VPPPKPPAAAAAGHDPKKVAGEHAATLVRTGTVVGLGTGSTAVHAVRALGRRVREEGLEIHGVPTSQATAREAQRQGIRLTTLEEHPQVDLTIDGADEVDARLNLIKGRGGALLREKIVAQASRRVVIICDPSKVVPRLGKAPLPVEVLRFGWMATRSRLERLPSRARLREKDGAPFVSDNKNFIIDCQFRQIQDPEQLEEDINTIAGVVENGLFVGLATSVVVGKTDGTFQVLKRK
jgi:ribose 5-phosphate isomerase A